MGTFDSPPKRLYRAPAKPHHGGGLLHGVGGFVSHLAGDVRDATVGIPMGMIHLVDDPVGSVKTMARTTWHDWSPLFHGHVSEWAHNFYHHPLAPLLDIASVVTLGGAAISVVAVLSTNIEAGAARVGLGEIKVGVGLGKFDKGLGMGHSKAIKVNHSDIVSGAHNDLAGIETYRHYSHNVVIRGRQLAMDSLRHQLADRLPSWFGHETLDAAGNVVHGAQRARILGGMEQGSIRAGKVRDISEYGKHVRDVKFEVSRHAAAAHYSQGRAMKIFAKASKAEVDSAAHAVQAAAFVQGGKMLAEHPNKVAEMIETDTHQLHLDGSIPVKPEDLRKVNGKWIAPSGFRFTHERPQYGHTLTSYDPTEFKKRLDTYGSRHTTRDSMKAARLSTGEFLLSPKHDHPLWKEIRLRHEEAANSGRVMHLLYRAPTKMWKYLVLATRPAYFVNNVVGNTVMYMVSTGPAGFRGLVDAVRNTRGDRATAAGLEGAAKSLHQGWVERQYGGATMGLSRDVMENVRIREGGKLPDRAVSALNVIGNGLYPVTHKVSDEFMRKGAIMTILRKHPEVQRLMRERKWTFDRAAEEVSKNRMVRDRVIHQVDDMLGQYHYLSPFEMKVREIVPFYTWDRAITRHGVNLALNAPTRSVIGAEIGLSGTGQTEKLLGKIPSFMKGVIPLPHGKVMTTQGLNPYSTIPDVVDAVRSLTVGKPHMGESLGGQINPVIAGAIQALTGQSLTTGAKLPEGHGGILARGYTDIAKNLPQVKLGNTLIHGEAHPKKGKSFLYRKDARSQALSLLGASIKHVNARSAHDLANRELGKKKRRRRKIHHGLF